MAGSLHDLKRMDQQYLRGGSLTLWCNARCQKDDVELNSRKRKKDADRAGSKTLMKMSGTLIKLSRNYWINIVQSGVYLVFVFGHDAHVHNNTLVMMILLTSLHLKSMSLKNARSLCLTLWQELQLPLHLL